MGNITVTKKNGWKEPFDMDKIYQAIERAAEVARGLAYGEEGTTDNKKYSGYHMSDEELACIGAVISETLLCSGKYDFHTSYIHKVVISALLQEAPDVGKVYQSYHQEQKEKHERFARVMARRNDAIMNGDRDNANADSRLSSTLKCLSGDYFEYEVNSSQLLTATERAALEAGFIYVHDFAQLALYLYNCCLLRGGDVMRGGFHMNGQDYTTPKRLSTAFSVLGDIIFMCASNQYGGCTQPRVDTVLAEYAEYEYCKIRDNLISLGVSFDTANGEAYSQMLSIMRQGFQAWEYKFNTVASSRGDYPFITLTGGADASVGESGHPWAALIWKAALDVRREGQGKEGHKRPVVFPKLVFLYDEALHGPSMPLEWLFDAGISCSTKAMYPDFLSLSGDGYVPSMYKQYGEVVSPMGCRAFLSPWYERGGMEPADKTDRPIFEGRFNIGVISLNLPLIYGKSLEDGVDFYYLLDFYLELIRRMFQRRYKRIGQMKAGRNPIMFCEGGAYGGNLKPTDNIEPLLKSATASFGVTALNELQQYYNGTSLVEDGSFTLEVMEHINNKIAEFKKEDGHLYAIYGTPAEKLAGLQAKQIRAKYGVMPGISDRAYVSNSFHCHVTEHITPIQKQNYEKRFWDLFNGGKIQYCKYPIDYNIDAVKTLVRRAMELGFFEGINLSLSYCVDCGHQALAMGEECPKCGSRNITQVDRMNGYLSYTRQGNTSIKGFDSTKHGRFNDSKAKEISERVSM